MASGGKKEGMRGKNLKKEHGSDGWRARVQRDRGRMLKQGGTERRQRVKEVY